jgi:hypothetical protein
MTKAEHLILGAAINIVLLFFFSLIYQAFLRELVRFERWSFLGDLWFSVLVFLVVPVTLFLFRKRVMAVGALLGIAIYFFLCQPLLFLIFGGV